MKPTAISRASVSFPEKLYRSVEQIAEKKKVSVAWVIRQATETYVTNQTETAIGATGTRTFYEFFAGGGMVRAGLGPTWQCLFANDLDAKKTTSYRANWGAKEVKLEDVGLLTTEDLPGTADLIWASFPCQDLSLAGAGAGLEGERSGAFWPFWGLVNALIADNRVPSVIALENVCGALTSHDGKDFASIGAALVGSGYRFGALVVDAVQFVPQSRPRLFVIAVHRSRPIPQDLVSNMPNASWHTPSLVNACSRLTQKAKDAWVWWKLPAPATRDVVFADLLESSPKGVDWHSAGETRKLLDSMTPINRRKVAAAKRSGRPMVGAIYKRTRPNDSGDRVVRAEVRFDDVAGCLRTPTGGSSRQTILIVEGEKVRSRLLSPREAARLMGLPDSYKLPDNYNDSYHLAGDGVVVPVVRHLAAHIIEPVLELSESLNKQAA